MENEKLKLISKELAKAIKGYDSEPEVYIASPFFDDLSKEYVTCKETEFDGMGVPYYSPRQDGINFNEVSGQLRSERIKAIFKNNVRNLNKCTHICVNLVPCNGKLDIGTLWELGYFIGKHGDPKFDTDEYSTLLANEGVKDLIEEIIKNLIKIELNQKSEKGKTLLVKNAPISRINDTIELMDLNYEIKEIPSTISSLPELSSKVVFLIDDYPLQSFILMGYMYAKNIAYYTASFKNFGSNVMIAASSKGHIQIPGLVDDTYRENMK